jgi:hypothetical protein
MRSGAFALVSEFHEHATNRQTTNQTNGQTNQPTDRRRPADPQGQSASCISFGPPTTSATNALRLAAPDEGSSLVMITREALQTACGRTAGHGYR